MFPTVHENCHFTKVVAQKLFLSLTRSLQDFPNLHHLYVHAIFIVFQGKTFLLSLVVSIQLYQVLSQTFFYASLSLSLSHSKIIIQKCLYLKHIKDGDGISPGLLKNLSLDIDDCHSASSFMSGK